MATSGTESSAAVATPVTAFIMPGPDVQQQHAGLARRPGIAVGGVRGGLLVPAMTNRIRLRPSASSSAMLVCPQVPKTYSTP